jgi:hypothetical protein
MDKGAVFQGGSQMAWRGRKSLVVLAAGVVVGAAGLWLAAFHDLTPGARISLNTPYQAVLLTNGQVFYGRLDKLGSSFPVLTEVYYIQSQVNQDTKQVSNTLIRRGKEWHAPDRMILNGAHIVLVEPVRTDSVVAKLIEELRKQP